jgi:type I restriction enzyme R subunit
LKPEDRARSKIDGLLEAAGWSVQDYQALNLGASLGVVVRNFPLKSGFGFASALLQWVMQN